MEDIIILRSEKFADYKSPFFNRLHSLLEEDGFNVFTTSKTKEACMLVQHNSRVAAVVFDWDDYKLDFTTSIAEINEHLPIFALSEKHEPLDLDIRELNLNIEFLSYEFETVVDNYHRITRHIDLYIDKLLPPFTRELMRFAAENKYTFCTPGHLGGTAFQKSPVGALFYDFYGENTFKADLSVSIDELGSLLDHSGPHKDAEEFTAKVFGADRSLFVTNGTSTANKIVGMYAASSGEVVMIDRNCHKSLTHLLMMIDVTPIYMKPTRNAHGILGGIPRSEFSEKSIKEKLALINKKDLWPSYTVITNSTYDGLFYDVENLKNDLPVKHIHFDSAWVPYTNFHPIYRGKYGMYGKPPEGKTIFETQSTHKLLAAFSQGSMIHIKGEYCPEVLNECYMMHTSTSPQYGIVASCETSAAMMQGKQGTRLIQGAIDEAVNFRREVKRLRQETRSWFYDVWQPENIDEVACWPLTAEDNWHGFKEVDPNHIYLDPIKVTITLPGIKDGKLEQQGIPAAIVAKYLDDNGIIVEKTGPYCMLFLFSMGIDRAKSMQLLHALIDFKRMYDENLSIKEILPSLYHEHPDFYKNMSVQQLADHYHQLIIKYDLPKLMYNAFDVLPKMEITPYHAYQHLVRGETEQVPLDKLKNKTSAVMILPYPPGIPLIMPGEKVTKESEIVLDYLVMLESIGKALPGFEFDIHGVESDAEGNLLVRVIREK